LRPARALHFQKDSPARGFVIRAGLLLDDIGGCRMGGVVVRFERRVASLAVITKLVELGYLQPGARHRATAVERAIDRLRSDLVRQRASATATFRPRPRMSSRDCYTLRSASGGLEALATSTLRRSRRAAAKLLTRDARRVTRQRAIDLDQGLPCALS
jgi:hypothetical protein